MARARTAQAEDDEAARLPGSFSAPLPAAAPVAAPPPAAARRGFFDMLGDPTLDPERAGPATAPPPPAGPGAAELPGAFTPAAPPVPTFGQRLAQGTTDVVHGLTALPGQLYDLSAIPRNLLASATGNEALRGTPAHELIARGLEAAGLPGEAGTDLTSNLIQSGAGLLGVAGPARAMTTLAEWQRVKPGAEWAAKKMAGGAGLRAASAGLTEPPVTAAGAEWAARELAGDDAAGQRAASAGLARTPGVARAVIAGLADNLPVQAAAAAGQGVAATVAPDVTDSPLGQFLIGAGGGLLGGIGAGLTGAAARAVRGVAPNLDADAMNLDLRGATDRAKAASGILDYKPAPENQTVRAPDGSFVSNPDQAAALRNLRTTGEATNDPGLIVAEKTVRGLRGMEDQFGVRDAQRTAQRGNVLAEITPAGTDPRAALAPLAATAAGAAGELRAAEGALPPPLPGSSTGPALQRTFTAERTAGGDRVRAALDAVDPEGTAAVPTRPLVRAIRESADLHLPSEDPAQYPPEVRSLLGYLSGRTVTYDRLRNIKQAAGSMAAGQPGSSQADFVMRDAMSAIENHLNTPGVLPPDVAARHQAYLQAARDQGQRFAGPIAEDLRGKDAGGRPTAEQSTIPQQYFQPDSAGGPDSMAAFRRYYTDPNTGRLHPDAAAAMQGHVGQQLLQFTDPTTGDINPVALSDWIGRHRQTLQAVPELNLYPRASNLAAAQRSANAAGLAGFKGPETLDGYQGNVARTLLNTEDMPQAIGRILNNDNPTAALRDAIGRMRGNRDGIEGLRQAVLDHWGEASVGDTPDVTGAPGLARSRAERWWDANGAALRNSGLFTPAELDRLQAVRDDLWSSGRVRAKASVTGSDTAPNLSNAKALADWALSGGQESNNPLWKGIKATVDRATFGFLEHARQARAGQLISRMYQYALDPEIAGAQMRRFSPETMRDLAAAVQRSTLRRHLARGVAGLGTAARAALPSAPAAIPQEGP